MISTRMVQQRLTSSTSAGLVITSLVCVWMGVALLFPGEGGRPVVVGLATAEPPRALFPAAAEASSPIRMAATAALTADDIARGVWALAAADGAESASREGQGAPPLSDPQRATLGPLLATAARSRAALGERRMARRAAERALLADGVALVEALGPERVAPFLRPPGSPHRGSPPPVPR